MTSAFAHGCRFPRPRPVRDGGHLVARRAEVVQMAPRSASRFSHGSCAIQTIARPAGFSGGVGDDALLHYRPSPEGEPSWIASSTAPTTVLAAWAPSTLDLATYDNGRDGRSSRGPSVRGRCTVRDDFGSADTGRGAVLSWPLDKAPSVGVRAARRDSPGRVGVGRAPVVEPVAVEDVGTACGCGSRHATVAGMRGADGVTDGGVPAQSGTGAEGSVTEVVRRRWGVALGGVLPARFFEPGWVYEERVERRCPVCEGSCTRCAGRTSRRGGCTGMPRWSS